MDTEMMDTVAPVPRPLGLTIVCWFLIVSAMMNVCLFPALMTEPSSAAMVRAAAVPPWVMFAQTLIGGAVGGIAGVAMLLRRPWGRMLYAIATPLLTFAGWASYGGQMSAMLFMGFAFYGAIMLVLMHRLSTAFLRNDPALLPARVDVPGRPPAPPVNVGRRIASIVLLIPAEIILMTGFMILGAMPPMGLAGLIPMAILTAISLAFILPALYLWGWSRWAIVMGVLLAIVGVELLSIGMLMQQMMGNPQFARQMSGIDPATVTAMFSGSVLMGAISTILGAALIAIQKVNDWRDRQPE